VLRKTGHTSTAVTQQETRPVGAQPTAYTKHNVTSHCRPPWGGMRQHLAVVIRILLQQQLLTVQTILHRKRNHNKSSSSCHQGSEQGDRTHQLWHGRARQLAGHHWVACGNAQVPFKCLPYTASWQTQTTNKITTAESPLRVASSVNHNEKSWGRPSSWQL
jgi:hypothetical protein